MLYLQAVIKEALRLHSAFAVILGREVPIGGTEIAGMYFPKGVSVAAVHNPYYCLAG